MYNSVFSNEDGDSNYLQEINSPIDFNSSIKHKLMEDMSEEINKIISKIDTYDNDDDNNDNYNQTDYYSKIKSVYALTEMECYNNNEVIQIKKNQDYDFSIIPTT